MAAFLNPSNSLISSRPAALLLFLARRSLPLVFPGFDLQRIVSIPVAGRIPEIFEVKPPKTHALILLPMAFFMAPQAQVVDALCQNEYAKRWQRDSSKAECPQKQTYQKGSGLDHCCHDPSRLLGNPAGSTRAGFLDVKTRPGSAVCSLIC